ncbi:hypothetical protein V9T40_013967 [Parthenolecanium corni]|uniref:Non-lysosomal glucosylceramidase n=1 Tax=Parthenolecanium corni TaxID=536013 RepID=A0AAN9Y1S4_9HEMI
MSAKIPKYGWKVRLDHEFPERRSQNFRPGFKIILSLIMLIIRYLLYTFWCYFQRKSPVMDYIKIVDPKQMYGVPLGGIGGGTIGRGFRGEFCRFQLKPGVYEYNVIDANQFIVTIRNSAHMTVYQNVLSPLSAPAKGRLSSWKWNFPAEDASYTALYPRAWTEYDIKEFGVKLICRQISPVFPNNYEDTSLPGSVFVWSVENCSAETLSVTVTFCLRGYEEATSAEPFEVNQSNVNITGMKIHNVINSNKCSFAYGARETEKVNVTNASFNPEGTGAPIWDQLKENGNLGGKLSSAVLAAKTDVSAGTVEDIEFVFVWHMPFFKFFKGLINHERYYTKYFGSDSSASLKMCHYAVSNYKNWETEIENWQNPILIDDSLPDWYKSAIFNELYFVSDGGTVWTHLDENEKQNLPATDPRIEFGRFAYLEGQEYRMYNTYDVHFYASFVLADMWPKLQLSIQYEFRDAVTRTDTTTRWFLYSGRFGKRKNINCIPHDIGDPEEEPFLKINSYPIHDVTDWKDLNLKFILQCYRDHVFIEDANYLQDMWPQVKLLMNRCLEWDTDDDGMIENGGFPDQTYDAWEMNGVSAYCGSLWLGALCSTVKMAEVVGDESTRVKFAAVLDKAKVAFEEKLWNGKYYDFDSGGGVSSKSIMADQLCGIWYLQCCCEDKILPNENVVKAMRTVYEFNVQKFKNGESGAVNGMLPNGEVDLSSVQSQEVWTGVTYAVASHLILQGLREEGLQTAKGLYNTVYNVIGCGFDSPEALYETKFIRAVAYMRALCIWSIQVALRKSKVK